MPEISFNESCRQIRAINERVLESEKAKDWRAAKAGPHGRTSSTSCRADHTAYSHRIEARMKRLARTLAGRSPPQELLTGLVPGQGHRWFLPSG
jgi:hypothetical protein